MDQRGSADIVRFDGFRFDRRRGSCLFRLERAGIAEPVRLGGRALALLGLLLERRGELLAKDEIIKAVWLGRVVEEANLNVLIAKLRQILDEGREQGSCIQTVQMKPQTPSDRWIVESDHAQSNIARGRFGLMRPLRQSIPLTNVNRLRSVPSVLRGDGDWFLAVIVIVALTAAAVILTLD